MDLGQWSSLWFFRKKLTSSCRSHRNISMTLKLWKLFSPSYNSSKRCFYAEGSFRCLMFVERSWHSNEEMLSLLDMLVHLPCVDAIAFLSVTRDDHVVRNVLCSHHAGYMILLLGEIPPQNRCAPDRPDQSPTFLTGTEGLKQQQPNKCLLFTWLLWQSVFGATIVEVLVPPAGKVPSGVLLCPPVWWGGGRDASSFLSDFVSPDSHFSFLFPPSSSFLPPLACAHCPSIALMAITFYSYQDQGCLHSGLFSFSAACWTLHKDLESCPRLAKWM